MTASSCVPGAESTPSTVATPNDGGVIKHVLPSKLARRLLPVLFSIALFAYFDRTSVALAADHLKSDTGMNDREYGFASTAFLLGYATLQMPSLLYAQRFGATRWLTGLMVAWGLTTISLMTLCCHRSTLVNLLVFYGAYFLMGCLQAGAFPSMYYYVSLVFESDELTVYYPRISLAAACSGVLGGMIAAGLLSLDGIAGLRSWQWLFLCEGSATILFACAISLLLPARPEQAAWLTPSETAWLAARRKEANAAADMALPTSAQQVSPELTPARRAARNWRTYYLCTIWALQCAAYYGIIFWMPVLIDHMLPGASAPQVRALEILVEYRAGGAGSCGSLAMQTHAVHASVTGVASYGTALQ